MWLTILERKRPHTYKLKSHAHIKFRKETSVLFITVIFTLFFWQKRGTPPKLILQNRYKKKRKSPLQELETCPEETPTKTRNTN